MTKTQQPIPSDGPDEALYRIVKRTKLRYSQAFVVQAITSHARPNTLLALVEVARRMGLKVTPVETDAEGLKEVRTPAIAHMRDPRGEGGFAVLEAVTRDGYKVWDSINGARAIDAGTFSTWWSGVLVLIEKGDEPGPREQRYGRQRFLEIVGGGSKTPAVDDPRTGPVLRYAFGLLAATLIVAAVFELSGSARLAAAAVMLLILIGTAAGLAMAAAIGEADNPLAEKVCRRGKLVDCHSVLASRYSRAFSIPLSDIGLSFYGALILLVASTAWIEPEMWRVVTLAFTATLPAAVFLMGVQVVMRQLCTLCLATHVVNVAGAVVGWLWLWGGRWTTRDLFLVILFALYLGLLLFVVIPYFRRGRGLTFLTDRHRRIASSPFATLAQLLSEMPTEVSGSNCGVQVAGTDGDHELLVLVHPSCGKCLPVLREVLEVAQAVPVRVFVGVAPKDPTEADRTLSSRLVAAWSALDGHRVVEGYVAAKSVLASLAAPDGTDRLAEQLSIESSAIESHTDRARSLVEAAEAAIERASGTPAVFFDSRPLEAPVGHLAYLIDRHPDLLGVR